MKNSKLVIITMIFAVIFSTRFVMGEERENLTESGIFRDSVNLLEIWVESVLDFNRLPGVSIAIVHDQDIVYTKGFGYANVKKGEKTTPENRI